MPDPGQPIRLLHLEDNERDAELIRHKLEISGLDCDITRVYDWEQFEAALAGESFQVILCDYGPFGATTAALPWRWLGRNSRMCR